MIHNTLKTADRAKRAVPVYIQVTFVASHHCW